MILVIVEWEKKTKKEVYMTRLRINYTMIGSVR